jgi:predicted TIM-barrel fold metal-dependent hydrolase
MSFFDSLVHATADGRWLEGTSYDASLTRLLAEMDRAGVERACLVGIADHPSNAVVSAFARQHPQRFVPIAGFNPAAHSGELEVAAALAELARTGAAGIKLHSRLNDYDPLDPRCLTAIDAAGDLGLPVFFCTICQQRSRSVGSIVEIVDRLATRPSRARIVLLHGGGTAILDLFELVRMHAHLLLDLSFTILRYAGSSLDLDLSYLMQQLDQRLVLGSDFPQYTPMQALERFDELSVGLSDHKRANILHANLERLLGVPVAPTPSGEHGR